MHTTAQTLFDRIESMPIYDTHEHLPLRPSLRIRPADVLTEYLSHYFDKDLISAGMPKSILEQALDTTVNIETRFAALEPWWDLCRFTGYGQSLDESVRGLYNEKRIDRTTIGRINEQFQKNLDDPGYFRTVLKDRCHICKSINDGFAHMKGTGWSDDELFAQVLRLDGYLDQWHWVFPVLESYGEDMHTLVTILIIGCIVAFAVSVFAIKFLLSFIQKHDFKAFGYYRIVLGIIVLIYFLAAN